MFGMYVIEFFFSWNEMALVGNYCVLLLPCRVLNAQSVALLGSQSSQKVCQVVLCVAVESACCVLEWCIARVRLWVGNGVG